MSLVTSTGAVMAVINLNVVTTLLAATIEAQSQLAEVSPVEGEFHMARILKVKTFSR
jgi:hypothetical protein